MGLERIPVLMICGLLEHGATRAEGLDAMLAALPGRETDLHRKWTEASAALGWRGRGAGRKEVETERLPRFDAASGLAVTASARLDGRDALCEALGLPRRDWAAVADSALILKSYGRWGRACPEHLLGDYAFALWDAEQKTLFCARDQHRRASLLLRACGGAVRLRERRRRGARRKRGLRRAGRDRGRDPADLGRPHPRGAHVVPCGPLAAARPCADRRARDGPPRSLVAARGDAAGTARLRRRAWRSCPRRCATACGTPVRSACT